MKDWTEALKEKFLEDRVTLPDGELEILEGLIRRRKQKRILSWTAVSFAAAASVALIIGFASRETEQLSNKYLAENTGEVTVASDDSYHIVSPSSLVLKPQASVVPFSVEQKEQEKEIINVEPETQDSTAEQDYGEELDDECPDGTHFDDFSQDSFREYEKAEGRESSNRFMLALSAGGRQNTNVYQDFAFVTTADEKYNHKPQLITYELSLRYQLSDRFGLSSGFCYYGTTSDVLMIDNNEQLYFKQQARYLGMPLHLDWYPLKRNRFSVYAGAGGEARKCVYAKRGDERLKDNRIYLSVIALAGLKYEPVRNIGLFVEPQYSHSFLPETPAVRSYITDTPDLFTVKVGLSIGF